MICLPLLFSLLINAATPTRPIPVMRAAGSSTPHFHSSPAFGRPTRAAALSPQRTQAATLQKSTMDDLLRRLLDNYDKSMRPPPANGTKGPVLVKVNIMIRMLSKIDVVNMEYAMQITLREQWLDKRLAYDSYNLTYKPKFLTVPYIASQIWMPDSFFPTEKAAHRHLIDAENMFIRIYPDGNVLYSVRLSLTCSCPMYLSLYPLDVQHCDFDLISYAFTTNDIVYEWDTSVKEPVQKKPGVGDDLPNFYLENIDTGIECTSRTNTGDYACLRMRMKLTRLLNYFILQLYFPTTMIVIVSWVSFWIDSSSTAGRVALAMTTLLTSFTLQTSINAKLPPVNYVKVIDVWLGACQTFVFGALIEYAVVCYMETNLKAEEAKDNAVREKQRRPVKAMKSTRMHSSTSSSGGGSIVAVRSPSPITPWDPESATLPCTCGVSEGLTSANSVVASLGLINPAMATLFPITAGLATGGVADQYRTDAVRCAHHSPETEPELGNGNGALTSDSSPNEQWSNPSAVGRTIWAALKHKLRKPDYLPARIDYYSRIYAPMGFLAFNIAYWSVCLYKASTWVHPTN